MRKLILVATTACLTGTAFAQVNVGSMDQSSQSSSQSTQSATTTSSSFDSSSANDPPQNQGSSELTQWMQSNSKSESSSRSSSSGFNIGFGRDNDDNSDDRPAWSRPHPSRPKPEQIDGTYRITAVSGPFLCTARLTASPFFGGYFASTSSGCPDLWKATRWDFEGPSIVLTSSGGDVYATFWPRDRDVWVGRISATGQRVSLSR